MSAPKRDWFWHLQHSLWMGWLFGGPVTGWLSFLHAGIRTRQPKWVAFAALYLAPLVGAIMLPTRPEGAPSTPLHDVVYSVFFIMGLVVVVHGCMIRKEYLMRLEAHDKVHDEKLKDRIEAEYGVALDEAPPVAYTVQAVKGQINLNKASEEELAALPGVGAMGAEMAVAFRTRNGFFRSVEAFGDAIGLSGAQVEALRPYVRLGLTRPMAAEQAEREARRASEAERET